MSSMYQICGERKVRYISIMRIEASMTFGRAFTEGFWDIAFNDNPNTLMRL